MAIIADHSPVHAAPRGWPWLERVRQAGQTEVLSGSVGRVVRRAAWAVVALVALVVVAFTAPMLWGYRPTLGRSMEPTLPVLGGFCKLEKLADPAGQLRSNDIVVVDGGTLGYSVKRVADVDPVHGLYLLGDNADRSMDSSFGADSNSPAREVWVPFDELKGQVTDIWSPERALRSRTALGRLGNWAALSFPPDAIRCVKDEGAVVEVDSRVVVYSAPGCVAWTSTSDTAFGGVDDRTLVVNRRGRSEVTRVDLVTLKTTEVAAPVAGRFVVLTPISGEGKLLPTMFCPQALPARFLARSRDGKEYRGSALPSSNPLGSIVVVVPALPSDGAVEVEVIEVLDEGTEIAVTPTN